MDLVSLPNFLLGFWRKVLLMLCLCLLHEMFVFTSWDVGQYVYGNCLLTRLYNVIIYEINLILLIKPLTDCQNKISFITFTLFRIFCHRNLLKSLIWDWQCYFVSPANIHSFLQSAKLSMSEIIKSGLCYSVPWK